MPGGNGWLNGNGNGHGNGNGNGNGRQAQKQTSVIAWAGTILAGLMVALIVALWDASARLAVVEANTDNVKNHFGETLADHERRIRGIERSMQPASDPWPGFRDRQSP